ncbi:MAG: hypothetical protein P8163_18305 [Candidatus Thiodiazotropha sp.]
MTTDSTMPKAETFFQEAEALVVARAIEANDLARLETSLARVDPNQPHKRGMTYLNWAFALNHMDAARVLLAHGADPSLETEGVSPWMLAMKMEDIRWLQMLVEAGMDINLKQHGSPVWFETYLAGNWDHLDYLLAQGIDLNATDRVGNTAAMDLARLEHYGELLKLLKLGADVKHVSRSGATLSGIVEKTIPSRDSLEFRNREKVLEFLAHKK